MAFSPSPKPAAGINLRVAGDTVDADDDGQQDGRIDPRKTSFIAVLGFGF